MPYSHPPVRLKFKRYTLDPDRDEKAVERCFRDAIRECGDRRLHFREMDDGSEEDAREWQSGKAFLAVVPATHGKSFFSPPPSYKPFI